MKVTVLTALPKSVSEKQRELIMKEQERGNMLAVKELLHPEEKQIEKEMEEPHRMKISDIPVHEHVTEAEILYHLYQLQYEGSRETVMDALEKYVKEHNISMPKLRYAVENIDNDYSLKYQSQYSEAIRDFLSGSDLEAVLTEDEKDAYYEEEYQREQEEEEEEYEYA